MSNEKNTLLPNFLKISFCLVAISFTLLENGLCAIDVNCRHLQAAPFQTQGAARNVCHIQELVLSRLPHPNFLFHVDYAKPSEIEELHFAPSTGFYRTPTTSDITYVPPEIFTAFPNLVDFEMSTNINELTNDDFKHAFNLTKLNLQDNSLKTIRTGVFAPRSNEKSENPWSGVFPLHKLRELKLSGNEISSIEANSFNVLKSLERLLLQYNELRVLRRGSFTGLPSLTFLVLHSNQIETIEDGALDLPALDRIHLDGNRLKRLPDAVFDHVPRLAHVSLNQNDMEHIGQSLYRLPIVETILLGLNRIEDIDLTAFARSAHLQELDLTQAGSIFARMKIDNGQQWSSPLKSLHLNSNGLSDAAELSTLRIFPKLSFLGLAHNLFTSLSVGNNQTLKHVLPALERVYISNNQISHGDQLTIEKTFEALGVTVLNRINE